MSDLPIKITPTALSAAELRLANPDPDVPLTPYGHGSYSWISALKATLEVSNTKAFKSFLDTWISHPDERYFIDILHFLSTPSGNFDDPYTSWLISHKNLSGKYAYRVRGFQGRSPSAPAFWNVLVQTVLDHLNKHSLLASPFLDSLLKGAESSFNSLSQVYEEQENTTLDPIPNIHPLLSQPLDSLRAAVSTSTDLPSATELAKASSQTLASILAKHTPLLGDPTLAVALAQSMSTSLVRDIFSNPSLSDTSKEMIQEWALLQVTKERVLPRIRAITKAMDDLGMHLTTMQRLRLDLILHDPNVSKSALDALAQIPDIARDQSVRPILMRRAHSNRRYLIMEHAQGPDWLALALRGLKETATHSKEEYLTALQNTTAHNLSGLSRQDLMPWLQHTEKSIRLLAIKLAAFAQAGPKTKPSKLKPIPKPHRI